MSWCESTTLSNDLKVILIPHKVGSVTCCLRGLAGSNYERPEEIGASHVLEHLCTYGSEEYPNKNDLRNIVLSKGGRVTGTTSRDDVAYLTKTLKDNYEDGIKYLFEVFSRPLLSEKHLLKTKSVIYHEIAQNIESPKRYIGRISYKILYPHQRFSIFNTGGVEDVEKLNLQNIKCFKNRMYSPSNFVLSVCGDLKSKEFFEIVKKYFDDVPNHETDTELVHKPNYKRSFLVENKSELMHTHLKIDYHGYKTSQKQKYSSYLLSKLLKAYLVQELNTLKNSVNPYILDCDSFNSNSYGLFGLYTSIDSKKINYFLKAFKTASERLCNAKVSRNELEFIKNKTKADFEFTLEKTSLRADFYSELFLYENLASDHQTEITNYLSTTAASIQKTARDIFKQEPKITVLDKTLNKDDLESVYSKIFD